VGPKKAAYTGRLPRSARDEDREWEGDLSGFPLIVLQQPAQPVAADNLVQRRHGVDTLHSVRRRRPIRSQRHVAEPLVGPETMIITPPLREDMPRVRIRVRDGALGAK